MTSIYEVKITSDAIYKYSEENIFDALGEIIWNGIDANAERIDIDFVIENVGFEGLQCTEIQSLKISDSGTGMRKDDIEVYLTQYNKSWKKGALQTDGRSYHGRLGVGRFKYFALGKKIRWETKCEGYDSCCIVVNYNDPKKYIVDSLNPPKKSNGTIVFIEEVSKKTQLLVDTEKLSYELLKRFALYLSTHTTFALYLNGIKLNPQDYIDRKETGSFNFESEGNSYKVDYSFLAWKSNFEFTDHKHAFLFDSSSNYKGMKPSGVNAGTELPYHTVLISTDYFNTNDTYTSDFLDNFSVIRRLYREELIKFLYSVRRDRTGSIFKDFSEGSFYPYKGNITNSIEAAEKDIFDVCAMSILEHENKIFASKNSSLRILFKLLKKIIEKSDDSAQIIADILELDRENCNALRDVLSSTPLPSVIAHYREMQRREAFLDVLDTLIHDNFYKKHLRERSQLHKIVERETWIFGKDYEYQLGTSDQALTKVLRQHLKINDLDIGQYSALQDEINKDANNLEKHLKKIPDLYLWRRYQGQKYKTVMNLVIELKAPKVDINKAAKTQAEKIYSGIAQATGSGYTVSENNKWEYYLISRRIANDIMPFFTDKQNGILNKYENYTIYAITWEDIIRNARFKLSETKRNLEINITEEHKNSLLEHYLDYVGFCQTNPDK